MNEKFKRVQSLRGCAAIKKKGKKKKNGEQRNWVKIDIINSREPNLLMAPDDLQPPLALIFLAPNFV